MSVLYINACVRDESRTDMLAKRLLQKFEDYVEIKLENEAIYPLHKDTLECRTSMIEKKDYSSDVFNYAKQFVEADIIVISAPFWDFSFPALLKIYLENIYITGLVSRYSEDGTPIGMCNAKKLYYVTTAGGKLVEKYSYDYVADLAVNCFGVKETELIMAEMLDVDGYNPEEIINKVCEEIDARDI